MYAGALDEVTRVLADLGLEPGSRLKTVGTLVDKLRRIPEPLSRIQDVAGARVVAEMTRGEQDRLVERITARFDDYRVKDRRAEPSFGYRAVHIIVRVQGRLVEIQVGRDYKTCGRRSSSGSPTSGAARSATAGHLPSRTGFSGTPRGESSSSGW